MLPTKTNLKEEIKHRLLLIEQSMENISETDFEYIILCNEHSQHSEILGLIEIFDCRIGFDKFIKSKYTPILDSKTKEPLRIGDKVENYNRQCGILKFCEVFNKYVIKTETGGQILSIQSLSKISELYDYKIDVTKVECRSQPYKKKW